MHNRAATPEPKPQTARRRVFVKTYGCQMNAHDSDRMAELLRPHGYDRAPAPEEADLVILNTCHIREKAAEKVYSDIGRLRPAKEQRAREGRAMTIAVAGCLAQAEGAEVVTRANAVDLVVGPQAYHRLPELLARRTRAEGAVVDTEFAAEEKFDALAGPREANGPSAFIAIQEGCDKFCTFCVVPYTRGAEVGRAAEAIILEASALAAAGVREVTLLGQNVNAWRSAPAGDPASRDIAPNTDGSWGLGQLCRRLDRIDELRRIRFTTSHPRDMDADLIEAFGSVSKLMPFLHLPVQSGSDAVLAAMNRGHSASDYAAIVRRLRAARPDIALSSDFIVGFPGETDADFEATLRLVEDITFASSYYFKYSRRPGTPAAILPRQVAEPVKEQRLAALQAVLERQKAAFNAKFVGRSVSVLFERAGRRPGQLAGRSAHLQSVHALAPSSLIGRIVDVPIVAASANALSGAPIAGAEMSEWVSS